MSTGEIALSRFSATLRTAPAASLTRAAASVTRVVVLCEDFSVTQDVPFVPEIVMLSVLDGFSLKIANNNNVRFLSFIALSTS